MELICEKSFSDVDSRIVNRFIEFQQAIIDKDERKLNDLVHGEFVLVHMSGKSQSKDEFISEVMRGDLNYFKSEIKEPTILWDDEENASLIADVTLTAEIYGNECEWTLNSIASFVKIGGEWYFGRWDN